MGDIAISLPTALIAVPFAGALVAMGASRRTTSGIVVLVTALVQVALIVAGVLALGGHGLDSLELAQRASWVADWNVEYSVRANAVSLGLVSLASLVGLCSSLFAWYARRERPGVVHGLLWLSTAALCGLFLARDLVLFYVCFELMLVPMILLVAGWGGDQRLRAAITMTIYTLLGSLLMLVGIIAVGVKAGTFDLADLAGQSKDFTWWMFASFLLAFAIKSPLLPMHGWLPLAYRAAPAEGSAMLSGVVSKAGAVGFLYVLVPLFPKYLHGRAGTALVWVCVAGIVYGSLAAFRQPDARGVVAYSSIAQMGLITLGLVVLGAGMTQAVAGAYLQTINHGIVSAALFILVGAIELRTGGDRLAHLGGLAAGRPALATLTMVMLLCAIAVPGTNVFASELLIFVGAWRTHWYVAAVASVGIVLAAMYGLRLVSALLHTPGDASGDPGAIATRERFGGDLRVREALTFAPLVVGMLALSVWPNALRASMRQRMVPLNAPQVTAAAPPTTAVAPSATTTSGGSK